MLIPNTKAFAYVTLNNHTLNGGVGNYGNNNRHYFITGGAAGYTTQINDAMHDWVYTTSRLGITTPISYVRTYTQSASVMDIYADWYDMYPYEDWNAWTEFWKYGTQLNPNNENWGWNKIYINIYSASNYALTIRKGIVAHEMGHCFGLNENNANQYSVMCQMGYGRQVTSAQPDDLNGINYLY